MILKNKKELLIWCFKGGFNIPDMDKTQGYSPFLELCLGRFLRNKSLILLSCKPVPVRGFRPLILNILIAKSTGTKIIKDKD